MSNHRIPPKPESYKCPKKGFCKWCALEILNKKGLLNLRASWHKTCLHEYKLIFWPRYTKRFVYMRDLGVCKNCSKKTKKWHLDHIQPLIEANGDYKFWQMDNLQTLCKKCHIKKTSLENSERSVLRKEKLTKTTD